MHSDLNACISDGLILPGQLLGKLTEWGALGATEIHFCFVENTNNDQASGFKDNATVTISARRLSVGMRIKNIHPDPRLDEFITITNTVFEAGAKPELDQIGFECKYGWSMLYCNETVELSE